MIVLSVFLLTSLAANGQNILRNLGERAKNAVENNLGNKVEKGVNDLLNGKKKDKDSKKAEKAGVGEEPSEEMTEAEIATQNAKNDFVRGSVILFEDMMDGEQVGEFPSKWDIVDDGSLEVAVVNGKKYAQFTTDYNRVTPLMTNPKHYLPEVFTIEWDMFISPQDTETKEYSPVGEPVAFGEMTPWFTPIIHKTVYNSSGYQRRDVCLYRIDPVTHEIKERLFLDYWNWYIGRAYRQIAGGNIGGSPAIQLKQFVVE